MKINTSNLNYRTVDLEQIQDSVFNATVAHIKEKREGKEKRLLQRLRKEQSRQSIAVLSV